MQHLGHRNQLRDFEPFMCLFLCIKSVHTAQLQGKIWKRG